VKPETLMMQASETPDEAGQIEPAEQEQPSSRRDFLRSAVAGVSLAGALPAVAMTAPTIQPRKNRAADPIEVALQRYGSEFGTINRIK
jgi:hypothetical protein